MPSSVALRGGGASRAGRGRAVRHGSTNAELRSGRRDHRLRSGTQVDGVDVTEALALRAGELAELCALRGYDAIHLASAEAILDEGDVMIVSDERLAQAAASIGIEALIPARGSEPRYVRSGQPDPVEATARARPPTPHLARRARAPRRASACGLVAPTVVPDEGASRSRRASSHQQGTTFPRLRAAASAATGGRRPRRGRRQARRRRLRAAELGSRGLRESDRRREERVDDLGQRRQSTQIPGVARGRARPSARGPPPRPVPVALRSSCDSIIPPAVTRRARRRRHPPGER